MSRPFVHGFPGLPTDLFSVLFKLGGNMLKSKDKTYFCLNERTRTKNKTLFFVLFFFLDRKVHGLRGSHIKFTVKKHLSIYHA